MPEGYDANDEKQVADARAAAGRRAKRLDDALAGILATANGRLWVWDLLGRTKMLRTPYIPGSADNTAFQCGEQNIGIQLFAQLSRASPELYALMIKENNNE